MVRVEYELSPDCCYLALSGHAGYARRGRDIVCAGVSALVRALQLCLETHFSSGAQNTVADGYACFSVGASRGSMPDDRIFNFFEMCIAGLRDIEAQYPAYVEMTDIAALDGASHIDTSEQTMTKRVKGGKRND